MAFRNEGAADRLIRVIAGVAVLALGWSGAVSGTLGTVFKVVGFIPLATGLVGWCPLYQLFGIRTCRVPSDTSEAATR